MTSEGYSPVSHGYAVEIDISVEAGDWPADAELRHMVADAVAAALSEIGAGEHEKSELSIVFTDDAAMKSLNAGWRGKDKPTNVLSFPAFPLAPGDALPAMLGDIVLGYETVRREADEEKKPLGHHICHLVVHGLLHLVGHDHESDEDAEIMEALERRALARLAIPDPYA